MLGLLAWMAIPNKVAAQVVFVADQRATGGGVTGTQVLEFQASGNPLVVTTPGTTFVNGYSSEGVRISGNFLYNSDFTNGNVYRYNYNQGGAVVTIASGLLQPAGIDLSPNGQFLYVAAEGSNVVNKYSTTAPNPTTPVASLSFTGAHDVIAVQSASSQHLTAGTVLVAAYNPSSGGQQGVVQYDANLTTGSAKTMVPGNPSSWKGIASGQTDFHPAGMALDSSGNLWVASAGTVDSTGATHSNNYIAEFTFDSSNGTYDTLAKITSTPLATVIGIEFGPDGNLYLAMWGNNTVVRLTPSTLAMTTWISSPNAGSGPKYLAFAVPEPSSFLLAGVGALAFSLYGWRRRKQTVVPAPTGPSEAADPCLP